MFEYHIIATTQVFNLNTSGAFGKVFRGELKLPSEAKFEDVAIKTIKSESNCSIYLAFDYKDAGLCIRYQISAVEMK